MLWSGLALNLDTILEISSHESPTKWKVSQNFLKFSIWKELSTLLQKTFCNFKNANNKIQV